MSNLTSGVLSSDDFFANIFTPNPRPIFFWDTCSLLNIIRLPYRDGDINTLKAITEIKKLIDNDGIYSICSELTIKEWNDHFSHIIPETQFSLDKTSEYHNNCIEMINHIFSTNFVSDHVGNKGLVQELEGIADSIMQKSLYLSTEKIANDALRRVANKLPPSKKKPEFKDCAIWETVLELASQVQPLGLKFVYLTVNTDDYVDKSRGPKVIHSNLISEAITYNVQLKLTFEEAYVGIL